MGKKIRGFTLIELVIVLAVLVLLITGVLLVLNPSKQLQKTYDAARLNDLNTITTSLDTYYHDTNCYPASIPFGQQWSSGSTTYAQKLPNDPQDSTNGSYVYFTDTANSCPQWNVVFSKLSNQPDSSACKLPTNCYPQNYDSLWACQVSGTVDCNSLIADSLPANAPTSIASNTQSNSTGNALSQKINVCHANGDGTYNQLQVTEDATADGHDGHAGDIIPSYSYSCSSGTCQYPGKNWDNTHQATYNNNCVVITTPTPTPTGRYALDDTKFLRNYAVVFFPYPSFSGPLMVDLSFRPDFGGVKTMGMAGGDADTELWVWSVGCPNCSITNLAEVRDFLQLTQKDVGYIPQPNLWTRYANGCGQTIYWRVSNFGVGGQGYDSTEFSPTYTSVIDCNTKIGAINPYNPEYLPDPPFQYASPPPLNWWVYYPYINEFTDEVSQGAPYDAGMDLNGDGKINYMDNEIGAMSTKWRVGGYNGGWQPPE